MGMPLSLTTETKPLAIRQLLTTHGSAGKLVWWHGFTVTINSLLRIGG